jgi:hypothetical protein
MGVWSVIAALVVVLLSFPSLGEGWITFRGPYGVTLCLPPGGAVVPHAAGVVRVELPFPSGTLLTELFLLLEAGTGPLPPGNPVHIGSREFLFSHTEEGAAGSRYESFQYATSLDERNWISLRFVIHTANPGMFPSPPPSYDRGAVLSLLCRA